MKVSSFHAVIGDEDDVHLFFFAHGRDDFGGFGVVSAENDAVSLLALDFLDNGAVVHRAGGDAFIQNHFRLA